MLQELTLVWSPELNHFIFQLTDLCYNDEPNYFNSTNRDRSAQFKGYKTTALSSIKYHREHLQFRRVKSSELRILIPVSTELMYLYSFYMFIKN